VYEGTSTNGVLTITNPGPAPFVTVYLIDTTQGVVIENAHVPQLMTGYFANQ
jgi:hypothetical protein